MPKALVIRAPGTNCDQEMCRGFALAGATPELVHVDRLIARPELLERADLIGFPGGFSYGDDVASGRILAVKLRERLWPALRDAARRGCPMIGACNGFQVMVQIGLLPGPAPGPSNDPAEVWSADEPPPQKLALVHNQDGRFIDRWLGMETQPNSICLWTQGLADDAERVLGPQAPEVVQFPIAHGEGRLIADAPATLHALQHSGQIALRYRENVNGSTDRIAGVCDPSGRIFGLMPHPERFLDWSRHPLSTRLPAAARTITPIGLRIFENAVRAVSGVLV